MASLRISQLANLLGTDVSANDLLAVVDMSASETKNLDITELALALGPLFPTRGIPGDKVDYDLPENSVETANIVDQAVTALKLANSSSGLYGLRPTVGDHIGQVCVDDGFAYMWDGTAWRTMDGPNAIIGLTWDGASPVQIASTSIVDGVARIASAFVDATGPRQFLAGPTTSGGAVTYRQIVGADIPTASALEQGVVQVSGGGLRMNGTLIELDNTITPSAGTFYLVDYDEHGQVVDSRTIQASDLPVATSTSNGVVRPGTGLVVTPEGELNHLNTTIAGEFTKVNIDTQGHVISAANLAVTDIPVLTADKISGGSFDPSLIGSDSIDETKLTNYSTCLIQPNKPVEGDYLGRFWLNPETSQLYAYAAGSAADYWIPVGFGRLAQENLRFAGTFDASTNAITTLTDSGIEAGLTIGPIPAAAKELTGVYLVCTNAGNAVTEPNISGTPLTEGDWILDVNDAWEFVDVGQGGGGGGGGATTLGGLLDVDVPTPVDGDRLVYQASTSMWVNQPLDLIEGGSF